MQTNTYLFFDGQCEEAMKFYADCFGTEVTMSLTFGETPLASEVPDEWQKRICHSEVVVGETTLMASDDMPGQHKKPQGFGVLLNGVDSPEEVARLCEALAAGGKVNMSPQETFWARSFCALEDRFGMQWMISCDKGE